MLFEKRVRKGAFFFISSLARVTALIILRNISRPCEQVEARLHLRRRRGIFLNKLQDPAWANFTLMKIILEM